MEKENLLTFETRTELDLLSLEILDEFSDLFSHLQHRLFADIACGNIAGEVKNDYLIAYDITARHFNALRVQVEGKISALKTQLVNRIADTKEKIASLTKTIAKFIKRQAKPHVIHQKKRRLAHLEQKLAKALEDQKNGTVRCCFGGKKLFHAQYNLEANGYSSHEEWRKDWKKARSGEIFFLGSKDETAGNQTCTATLQPDETIQLRIRLPKALEKYGKYLVIQGIKFKYGKEELQALLKSETPQAITWRFKRDEKGWRIFSTFAVEPAVCTSKQDIGVIGLDINADHFALVETDPNGNPISTETIPYNLHGKSSAQAKAIIGDAAASAVAFAGSKNKPLIIEELDFRKKKSELREKASASYARMLSSFAYNSLITHLKSRASKQGVFVSQVNPAYTSIIGRVKFAKRYGLSIHHAAALTIGRRYLRFSEKVPSPLGEIPDGKDSHVTLTAPVRKRDEHEWSVWSRLSKKLRTALAAHFRTAKSRSKSPPKTAFETEPISDDVGETPTRESLEPLFA